MPADENTRLRIRQYLIELMDEDAADAILESMPPIPWTELATKADIARLEARLDGNDRRFDGIDQRFDLLEERFGDRFDTMDRRLDLLVDTMDRRFDALVATIEGNMVGLEGRLAMRFTEATRVMVFAVLLLMTAVITAVIAVGG